MPFYWEKRAGWMRRCGNCIRKMEWDIFFAISGLHMSLIGMGLYSFLRKAGTSFFTAGMAGSSFPLLYTGMTGNGIASQRAWIMFAMRMGAEITGREYDALTGLAAAAVWICLRQPLYLTDAGFLLSFWCNFGDNSDRTGVCGGKKAEKEKKEREKEAGFPERTFSKFCSEYGTDGTGTLVLL